MCNCKGRVVRTWTVTYPGGATDIKHSETAAARAAQRVAGATYVENPRG